MAANLLGRGQQPGMTQLSHQLADLLLMEKIVADALEQKSQSRPLLASQRKDGQRRVRFEKLTEGQNAVLGRLVT